MKISIIIPFYNGENFCEKIFKKIFEQTYTNFEVICVDDGSTDNTLSILKNIEKFHKKVKVYTQNNTGPGLARRLGFEKSTGEVILFYDSDDALYDKHTLKNIISIVENNNPDVIFYDLVIKKGKNNYVSHVIDNFHNVEGFYNINILEKYIFKTNLYTKVFKAELLDNTMFCNGKNFEDAYTLLNYLYKCNNFYYTTKHFYINDSNLNPDSLTKTIDPSKLMQVVDVLNSLSTNEKFGLLKKYKCFDMYCYQFKNLYKNRKLWSKNDIKHIKRALRGLRKMFYGDAMKLSIKYFSFKRYILYILSYLYL